MNTIEMLRAGKTAEIWQSYCGFFDLTTDEFVATQKRLLAEQLRLLANCELGRKLTGSNVPLTPGAFRKTVPLTTYSDYCPYLPEKREEMLPSKPVTWMRTSGRTEEYGGKWVPVSQEYFALLGRIFLTTVLLSGAHYKGEVAIHENISVLQVGAPPPFITGVIMKAALAEFPVYFIPRVSDVEKLSFQERVQQGFEESMGTGLDYFMGIASILAKVSDAFTQGTSSMSFSSLLTRPTVILRLLRALASSKLEGRQILPKDIWKPRGIGASGMDVQIYRQRIRDYWGCDPLEVYACTEFGTVATQAWGNKRNGLTFVPDSAFWEFLPEEEYASWRQDSTYQPNTVLLDELQPGRYVLVGTSLAGGAFVRYIIGDLVRVISLRDDELGIQLPQLVMESRIDDVINLGSLVVLTERSIYQAIVYTGQDLIDWFVRKEFSTADKNPRLHFYVEGKQDPDQLSQDLHNALVNTHEEYQEFNQMMGDNLVVVTMLTPGTFHAYTEEKQAEGAELGQLKPVRVQPPEMIAQRLLSISAKLNGMH